MYLRSTFSALISFLASIVLAVDLLPVSPDVVVGKGGPSKRADNSNQITNLLPVGRDVVKGDGGFQKREPDPRADVELRKTDQFFWAVEGKTSYHITKSKTDKGQLKENWSSPS
jgi:hypothetical protein